MYRRQKVLDPALRLIPTSCLFPESASDQSAQSDSDSDDDDMGNYVNVLDASMSG